MKEGWCVKVYNGEEDRNNSPQRADEAGGWPASEEKGGGGGKAQLSLYCSAQSHCKANLMYSVHVYIDSDD